MFETKMFPFVFWPRPRIMSPATSTVAPLETNSAPLALSVAPSSMPLWSLFMVCVPVTVHFVFRPSTLTTPTAASATPMTPIELCIWIPFWIFSVPLLMNLLRRGCMILV